MRTSGLDYGTAVSTEYAIKEDRAAALGKQDALAGNVPNLADVPHTVRQFYMQSYKVAYQAKNGKPYKSAKKK
jgi:hypothetical protein